MVHAQINHQMWEQPKHNYYMSSAQVEVISLIHFKIINTAKC